MPSPDVPGEPPLADAIGAGVLAGTIGGFAAGLVDAIWSWGPAAQFVPGVVGRLRFALFGATADALTGAAVGLAVSVALLAMSRATRLGDALRFLFRYHGELREADPRRATVGLSLALAGLPVIAVALVVAYRACVPFLANRHVVQLEIIVAMAATLGALVVALPLVFLVARPIEAVLARLVPRAPWLASVWGPFVAIAALVVAAGAVWAHRDWETVRILPLRGPIVAVVGLVLAAAALRPARYLVIRAGALPRWPRRAGWVALPVILLLLVLATGASNAVIKSATAYSGLGGPIAHTLRRAFDWDHDGYSRFLGGGDCDDGDASVHPGAAEIPDDGIDQDCIGGDANSIVANVKHDAAFAPVPPSVPADFDVLLVTIDTTRADHLGAYGYARPTSPNLDALGKDGVVFEHAWAHAPSTRYSMPAILTGRLPLDVYYDTTVGGWPGIQQKATTIAESLQALGFVTGAITNYDYFKPFRHMDQGFSEYDNEDERLHTSVSGAGPEQTHGSSSKEQTDKALAFVDRHAGQRWFLWVHYYDPHYAYEAHEEVPSFGTDRVALYDGEIRYTDLHIGRLLDGLRAKGLYDKTVVVVTGDHGEGFGEHGVLMHGYHLYSAQTRVPLIVKVPGLPARRAQTPAGHVDILPTLVNLAGGKATDEMMGMSLVSTLAQSKPDDPKRVVFQQLSYEGNHEMRGGVDATCHVIYNVSPDPSWEVYRDDTDPMETEDLSDDRGECKSARSAVETFVEAEQIPAGALEALLPARPQVAAPLDIDLGDGARLLAVDAPPHAKPGETISLTWTFEARAKIPTGWKMFVHAEGPNKVFVNGDHRPTRPFEWWKPGQFIRYTTTLAIPRTAASGAYTVWAGMFLGGKRAPAKAPHTKIDNDAAAVATFQVGP